MYLMDELDSIKKRLTALEEAVDHIGDKVIYKKPCPTCKGLKRVYQTKESADWILCPDCAPKKCEHRWFKSEYVTEIFCNKCFTPKPDSKPSAKTLAEKFIEGRIFLNDDSAAILAEIAEAHFKERFDKASIECNETIGSSFETSPLYFKLRSKLFTEDK